MKKFFGVIAAVLSAALLGGCAGMVGGGSPSAEEMMDRFDQMAAEAGAMSYRTDVEMELGLDVGGTQMDAEITQKIEQEVQGEASHTRTTELLVSGTYTESYATEQYIIPDELDGGCSVYASDGDVWMAMDVPADEYDPAGTPEIPWRDGLTTEKDGSGWLVKGSVSIGEAMEALGSALDETVEGSGDVQVEYRFDKDGMMDYLRMDMTDAVDGVMQDSMQSAFEDAGGSPDESFSDYASADVRKLTVKVSDFVFDDSITVSLPEEVEDSAVWYQPEDETESETESTDSGSETESETESSESGDGNDEG